MASPHHRRIAGSVFALAPFIGARSRSAIDITIHTSTPRSITTTCIATPTRTNPHSHDPLNHDHAPDIHHEHVHG